ncbi:unnamed protein product [Didymodactylos carnosus]|uniref:Uncharacterized protein n=1 Tax=Didymodactylos carnosus TaxID=1234261 RepID=A0A814IJ72_9BILA|nr:unnamed protein product [Didymodactylos carnosus]CAF1213406.1 unnamed protein product [Didymodactylos carnosus]CAF3796371.1 unnamed protein product [Didymodactylos carnosus]CAF4022226.1 unnamed protein product [Didymodactylos carnosus]
MSYKVVLRDDFARGTEIIDFVDNELEMKGWPKFITPSPNAALQEKLETFYDGENNNNDGVNQESRVVLKRRQFVLAVIKGFATHGRVQGYGSSVNALVQKYKSSHVFPRDRVKFLIDLIYSKGYITFEKQNDSSASEDGNNSNNVQKPTIQKVAVKKQEEASSSSSSKEQEERSQDDESDGDTEVAAKDTTTNVKKMKPTEDGAPTSPATNTAVSNDKDKIKKEINIASSASYEPSKENIKPLATLDPAPHRKHTRRNANQMLAPWAWLKKVDNTK